jgi:hypothetical protein
MLTLAAESLFSSGRSRLFSMILHSVVLFTLLIMNLLIDSVWWWWYLDVIILLEKDYITLAETKAARGD